MTALAPAAPDTITFSAASVDYLGDLGATVAGRFRAGQFVVERGSVVRVGTQAVVSSALTGVDPDSL